MATEWAQRTLHNIVSCFDDTGICMYGCCCPCLRQKDTADKIGENGMLHCIQVCCGGVPHLQHPPRHEIREKYSLEDNMVMDIVFSCLCPCLVICQLANEVEDREGGGGGAGPSVAKTATT